MLPECRWFHEPQPISNQPVGLGFPHRAGRYRPGVPPFRPHFAVFVIHGRISDPGMGSYPPRVCLALPSTNPRLGFPHRAGPYRPGGPPFTSPVCGVVDVWKDL